MHIVIPDDYQNVVRSLDCFALLEGHRVSVYHDAQSDLAELAVRFADADALVLTRERTRIDETLLARLPRLKLISQTGKGAVMEGRGSPIAPAKLAWNLMLMSRRQSLPAIEELYAGQ